MKKLLMVVVAVAWSLVTASVALAHSEPATVSPGQDAVLVTAPTEIVIFMSEEMVRQAGANDIVVQNSQGKSVTVQPAAIDDSNRKKLSVPLPTGLAPGVYVVRWRTTSAGDGDKASGNYSFKFDPAGPANAGKEKLRDDSAATDAGGSGSPSASTNGDGGGTSWVLLAAVAVGMLVLGAGVAFLFIQKRE